MCLIIIKCLFFLLCLIVLPIIEIFFSVNYKDDITCKTSIYIDVSTWLIIHATISLVISCINLNYLISESKCSKVIYYIFSLLYLLWLILGSIILWQDCYNFSPNNVYILMWISLISSYIFYITTMCVASLNNKDNKKEPLLSNYNTLYSSV